MALICHNVPLTTSNDKISKDFKMGILKQLWIHQVMCYTTL
jgi:hypothetical protein